MTHQPDPLDQRWQQEQAEDHATAPITLDDLSELEREALGLLKTPHLLDLRGIFGAFSATGVLDALRSRKVISAVSQGGAITFTPDGARLQAELWQQGGGG